MALLKLFVWINLESINCQVCFLCLTKIKPRLLIIFIIGNSDGKSPDECGSETSSVTVACLTERIHQMEESHISTHEELEATVQVALSSFFCQ